MAAARPPHLAQRSKGAQWLALLALSAVLVALIEAIRLPAALLIGTMTAGILIGIREGTIRVPAAPYIAAQGLIGCMIGLSVPANFVTELARDWPIFLAGIASVIVAASALGLVMMRFEVLPGTTAIWGTSPGASTSMIVMAEAYGGDIRLVAFMQQLRIICVAVAATVVAKLWTGAGGQSPVRTVAWFPQIDVVRLAVTLAIAFAGAWGALWLRIPAGTMLLPLGAIVALRTGGWQVAELPPWLLAACYAVIGWNVGLRFTRAILLHAFRALPVILGSIVVLMAVCGAIAAAMVVLAGIDPLTAYLATCPGGLDSVAIIAVASNVDVGFVMAMQTMRLLLVLVTSPIISRHLATRLARPEKPPDASA